MWAKRLSWVGLLLPSVNPGNWAVIFKVLLVKIQVRTGALLLQVPSGLHVEKNKQKTQWCVLNRAVRNDKSSVPMVSRNTEREGVVWTLQNRKEMQSSSIQYVKPAQKYVTIQAEHYSFKPVQSWFSGKPHSHGYEALGWGVLYKCHLLHKCQE